jgi:U4/U6 small nuclear ribonucleoprotein PRP4
MDKPGTNQGNMVGISPAVLAGMRAGHINISNEAKVGMGQLPDKKKELLDEFEKKKRARAVVVPTSDSEIKAKLREMGHPICYFGEGPADRRERLRSIVADLAEKGIRVTLERKQETTEQEPIDEDSVWYHEGPNELLVARYFITEYSMPRARDRLEQARLEAKKPGPEKAAAKQELHKKLRDIGNLCSQVGDIRPISYCDFSPDSKLLATASWTGTCKLWSVPDCEPVRSLKGHSDRAGAIVFHPQATLSMSTSSLSLASCAADGSVCLWNLESESPIAELESHKERVARLSFHPSGRFIGTACYDHSWRLFDLETNVEVLHQVSLFNVDPVLSLNRNYCNNYIAPLFMNSNGRYW